MPSFGTLKADTLTHSTAGSLATNYVVNGSAKAWINYNTNTSTTVTNSLNVSSLTDNGTGDTSITVSSAFADIGYTYVGASGNNSARMTNLIATLTTTVARPQCVNTSPSADDEPQNFGNMHGDLA